MAYTKTVMSGVLETLLSAVATGNGNVRGIPPSIQHHTIYIIGSAGVASGAVQLESSDDPDYAGTWAPIGGGPITVVASSELVYNWEGTYRNIRVRISTTIGSGTVTVKYLGAH